MICGYRFTKRQGILVLLLAAILGAFLVVLSSPAALTDACGKSEDCREEIVDAERSGVRRRLHAVRQSNHERQERKKLAAGYSVQLHNPPGTYVMKWLRGCYYYSACTLY